MAGVLLQQEEKLCVVSKHPRRTGKNVVLLGVDIRNMSDVAYKIRQHSLHLLLLFLIAVLHALKHD